MRCVCVWFRGVECFSTSIEHCARASIRCYDSLLALDGCVGVFLRHFICCVLFVRCVCMVTLVRVDMLVLVELK